MDLGPGAAAGGMGITENITKRWLRQTLVVERGIAVSYKYNPLASVPVPEICVPVLCSRAQKVAVIVIKRKCRLIPDLPAPVAQLFVPGGSVDIMTNGSLQEQRFFARTEVFDIFVKKFNRIAS